MRAWHEQTAAELEALAAAGDAPSMRRLSDAYQGGLRGLPVDPARAVSWIHRAAELGSARAAMRLGDRYSRGIGVPESQEHAVGWWRAAAQRGLMDAQANLAAVLLSNPATHAEAQHWLQAAARQGQPYAIHTLQNPASAGRSHAEKMAEFAAMSLEEMAALAPDDEDTLEASFGAKGPLLRLGAALGLWIQELAHGDAEAEVRGRMDGALVDFPGSQAIEPSAVERDEIEVSIALTRFGTISVTVTHFDDTWALAVSSSQPRPTSEQGRHALARLEANLRAWVTLED